MTDTEDTSATEIPEFLRRPKKTTSKATKPSRKKVAANKKADTSKASTAKKPTMTAAQKAKAAAAEAARLLKAANVEATREKKQATAAKEAARLLKVEEATHKRVVNALATDAKEINHRYSKANKLVADADDHRLAASLRLADAKDDCRSIKLNFKDWCEENLTELSYNTARQMLPIGVAENEKKGAGKLMLADMRASNKAANKKSRDKAKAGESEEETSTSKSASAPKPAKKSPDDARAEAEDAFGALGAKAQVSFVKWAAEEIGGTFAFDE